MKIRIFRPFFGSSIFRAEAVAHILQILLPSLWQQTILGDLRFEREYEIKNENDLILMYRRHIITPRTRHCISWAALPALNQHGKVTGLKFEIVLVLSLVVVVQSKVLLNDLGARLMNSGPWIQVALFDTFSARKSWTVLQVDENPVFKIGLAFSAVLFPFDSISIDNGNMFGFHQRVPILCH